MDALHRDRNGDYNICNILIRTMNVPAISDPGLERKQYLSPTGYKSTFIKVIEWGPTHKANAIYILISIFYSTLILFFFLSP
jgi:hypothetical protein